MESSVATLTRHGAGGSAKRLATPAGLGGGGAALLTPARAPARPSGLRRQATFAKGTFVPAALPLFDVRGAAREGGACCIPRSAARV